MYPSQFFSKIATDHYPLADRIDDKIYTRVDLFGFC
jgi:hypothetical protein